jgi:hypothetical protein
LIRVCSVLTFIYLFFKKKIPLLVVIVDRELTEDRSQVKGANTLLKMTHVRANNEHSSHNTSIAGAVQKIKGPRRGSHHMFPLPARDDEDNCDDEDNSNHSGSEQDPTLISNKGPYGRPAYLPYEELLEPFPSKSDAGVVEQAKTDVSTAKESNDHSVTRSIQAPGDKYALEAILKKNKTQAELLEQYNRKLQSDKYTSLSQGEAARLQQLVDSQDLPGGSNFRPLVGGFAAAAYEAAKAHHYENKKASSLGHIRD